MVKERACRECRRIVTENKCDNCGSANLSSQFSGLVIILNPEASELARMLGITRPGRYALKVE